MEDYKQLLAEFDAQTGKRNLVQANQTASKLFRLILEGRIDAVTVSTEITGANQPRTDKQFLSEPAPTSARGPLNEPAPTALTRGQETILANDAEWERAAADQAPAAGEPVELPAEFENTVTPEEALAAAASSPVQAEDDTVEEAPAPTEDEAPKPAPKKAAKPKKDAE